MPTKLPASERDMMDALVTERWYMLTMDTEVDNPERTGEVRVSDWTVDLETRLAYAASRLAGDGFEGAVDTRDIVDELMETITERLTAFGVGFRLASASPATGTVAA